MNAKKVNIRSVSDYLKHLNECWKDTWNDQNATFIYRGQSDVSYILMPTLLRIKSGVSEDDECHRAELEYPDEFDRHHHLSTLVKMRHFCANTRLLDFSRNPLIALYFACSSLSAMDKPGRVFVVKEQNKDIKHHGSDAILVKSCLPFLVDEDKRVLFDYCRKNSGVILDEKSNGQNQGAVHDAIHHLYHEIRSEYPTFEYEILADDLLKLHFVAANKDNERMKAQDGLFAFFGLDANGCKNKLENKVKLMVDIPSESKKTVLMELDMLRINDSTVYPGVERTLLNVQKKILNIERKYKE